MDRVSELEQEVSLLKAELQSKNRRILELERMFDKNKALVSSVSTPETDEEVVWELDREVEDIDPEQKPFYVYTVTGIAYVDTHDESVWDWDDVIKCKAVLDRVPDVSKFRSVNSDFQMFHIAVEYDCVEHMKLMVNNGMDINLIDPVYHRNTPLHIAAGTPSINALKYLIELGADPNIRDEQNHTALYFPKKYGYQEATHLLEEYTKRRRHLDILLEMKEASNIINNVQYDLLVDFVKRGRDPEVLLEMGTPDDTTP